MPDNPIIREIARLLDAPIMTTSLPADEDDDIEYTTNPELIDEKFGNVAQIVIDGGIGGTQPSTMVDCTGSTPVVIREGKGVLSE
jgi:tRNA A37 threonylcarbamoyladenosine synthetase subunit TsaC/SUA5/YrdC